MTNVLNRNMPAGNKHIGKMSAEVTIQIFARPFIVGDNPSRSAVLPPLRQYAGTLSASGGQRTEQKKGKVKEKTNKRLINNT